MVTLRLAANGLAFLLNFSLLRTVFSISLRSGNRFHLFAIYRIFCFNYWEFKYGSRVVVFGSGDSLYFSCQFEYLDLVQNLLVHGYDFRLPTAIILRVEWVFAVFC